MSLTQRLTILQSSLDNMSDRIATMYMDETDVSLDDLHKIEARRIRLITEIIKLEFCIRLQENTKIFLEQRDDEVTE